MNTKLHIIIFALVILTACNVLAQVQFGIKGGMNISTLRTQTGMGMVPEYQYRTGFNAGLFIQVPLNTYLSFQPELMLSTRGTRNETTTTYTIPTVAGYSDLIVQTKSKTMPCYLAVPLYLKGTFQAGNGGNMICGIGPYVACGIGGKIKYDMSVFYDSNKVLGKGEMALFKKDVLRIDIGGTEDKTDAYDKPVYKRFDVGFSGFIGYELNLGAFAAIGYDLGCYNFGNVSEQDIEIEEDVNSKIYNRTFWVSVGYKF